MRWEVYPKNVKKGGKVYTYYRVRIWFDDGSVDTFNLPGARSETEAFVQAEMLATKAKAGKLLPSKSLSLERWIAARKEAGLAGTKKNATVATEYRCHRLFIDWLAEHHPRIKSPRQITSKHIHQYYDHRHTLAGPATWNRHRAYLSGLFAWSKKTGIVKDNPVLESTRDTEPQPDTNAYTMEQLDRILAHLQPSDLACLLLQFNADLRPSEALRFEMKDLDLSRMAVLVRDRKATRRQQWIAVDPVTAVLLQYTPGLYSEGPAFPASRGRMTHYRQWTDKLKAAAKAAGVPVFYNIGWAVRHTGATKGAEKAPQHAITRRLGHTTGKTTERYMHALDTDRLVSDSHGISERVKVVEVAVLFDLLGLTLVDTASKQ